MRTTSSRRPSSVAAAVLVIVALGLGVSACGGSDGSDGAKPGADTTTTKPASTSASTVLAGKEICSTLSADAVGAALALDIQTPGANEDAAPKCSYPYLNDLGVSSVVVVQSQRPTEELGDRTGAEAVDFMATTVKTLAGASLVEEADVAAGVQAKRFTGAQSHIGIIDMGSQLLLINVPAKDATGDQVDALMATVAETLT